MQYNFIGWGNWECKGTLCNNSIFYNTWPVSTYFLKLLFWRKQPSIQSSCWQQCSKDPDTVLMTWLFGQPFLFLWIIFVFFKHISPWFSIFNKKCTQQNTNPPCCDTKAVFASTSLQSFVLYTMSASMYVIRRDLHQILHVKYIMLSNDDSEGNQHLHWNVGLVLTDFLKMALQSQNM